MTAVPHYPLGNIPNKYRRKLVRIEHEGKHRVIRVCVPPIPHIGFARRLLMYMFYSFASLLAIPIIRRPEVIWAASPSIFSSYTALIYHILFRAPIVRNVDDLWPETAIQQGIVNRRLSFISKAFAKVAYHFSRSFTPISKGYIKTLRETYSIPSKSIYVAEVGVDTQQFYPASTHRSSRENFNIVYSGILGVGYDFRSILKAAEHLSANKSIRILIRGVGEMEDFIRNYINEKNLSNVTLSTEFLEFKELVKLLQEADALLLPMSPLESIDSGVPTKLMEYMSCGRPIICMSRGASAEIVEDAECGCVVNPGKSKELAEAILDLSKSPDLLTMGVRAREHAVQHFSLPKIAEKLEEAFNHAMGKLG